MKKKFQVPATILAGEQALVKQFGRRREFDKATAQMGDGGVRIMKITVEHGGAQLDLFIPSSVTIEAASQEDLMRAIGAIVTNGTWRFFMACFLAASEDTGLPTEGTFWYAPTRFGDMLAARAGGRHHQDRYRQLDGYLETLGNVRFSGTAKIHGKQQAVWVDRLVYYAHASAEERLREGPMSPAKRRGRRSYLLHQINPVLMSLLHAYSIGLSPLALRTPPGVSGRAWDDAFKLYTLLAGKARYPDDRGADLPCKRLIDKLADDVNIGAGERRTRPGSRRDKVLELAGLLEKSGFLKFGVDGELIRFAICTPEVGALAESAPTSKRSKRSKKRSSTGATAQTRALRGTNTRITRHKHAHYSGAAIWPATPTKGRR